MQFNLFSNFLFFVVCKLITICVSFLHDIWIFIIFINLCVSYFLLLLLLFVLFLYSNCKYSISFCIQAPETPLFHINQLCYFFPSVHFFSFILDFPLGHNEVHSTLLCSSISNLFNSTDCIFISYILNFIIWISIFIHMADMHTNCMPTAPCSFNAICRFNHQYIFICVLLLSSIIVHLFHWNA